MNVLIINRLNKTESYTSINFKQLLYCNKIFIDQEIFKSQEKMISKSARS